VARTGVSAPTIGARKKKKRRKKDEGAQAVSVLEKRSRMAKKIIAQVT